ncbi:FUSC family protein [Pantoea dispersa]|uniref:FUSC family protein n=1 Tax=Pantoea dispersa TaxID=59814 RepID=UPI0021F75576|nr:FUSC family protein [Pantoea dispersa]MCW0321281.1 p-hydroxybenzoic acid efflux pump subunit AaeB [Pantoea dispersa]MCW0326017.1 p-hydroxybenzoic acid efflux pump subunit AaeB [Pantoea dispersa]MCW0432443.1 p-hydroxybenzoic acid efflux pump subunit AaeB [Pantoea dispersa]
MKWFSRSAVLFSAKTCLAAFLAFYLALELNLDKPAWSLTTVYVASQLYSASTVSKSVFRFFGTVLGGLFTLLIYPATVQSPMLFSLCISLWVAVCLYLSLHDRTPKSYVFMLAGYSAAIMGFPDVTSPGAITYTVISRIEEITVAIVCSSLVHRLIFPVSMRHLLEQSVGLWYQNARKLCSELMTAMPAAKSLEREDILVQMANYPLNVETLITHCVYEGDAARRLVRLVSVQYQHLSYLIPTLTAIESRLNLLAQQQIRFPDYVATAFQQFLQWLNGDAQQPVRDRLTDAQEQLQQAWRAGRLNSEESILLIGLLERLLNFVRIADAYHSVSERVSDWTPAVKPGKASRAHKHVDKGLLLLSCFTAFIATFATCLFWIGSGWRDGSTAPMMAAVLCSFFAGLDSPIAPMKLFLKGVLISMAISLIYVTLLIPQAVTFEALVICLAPGLFALGLVIANPSTNLIGLIVATQIPGLIGMSHHFKPDLQLIVNAMISTLVGIAVALVLTLLIRNKRPAWTATRALRKGIRDLLQFITALHMNTATLTARQQFVARTLDRVNVILPRKRVDPAPELVAGGNLIAEAWLGANCYDYCTRHRHLLLAHQIESAAMFHELSQFLKQRLKTLDSTPSPVLLHELDVLLLRLEAAAQQENALFAPLFHLFNIRLSLFPGARWPQPLAEQNRT